MRSLFTLSLLAMVASSGMAQSNGAPTPRPIEGQYIVVFKSAVAEPAALAAQLASQKGGQLLHTYRHALKGFAARLPAEAVDALRNNPHVESVEQDATISLSETAISPPLVQSNPTWGLNRVDQRALPLNTSYQYQYTGTGVYAFVVDTGILAGHADFGGRVAGGFSAINDGLGTSDCNGHGTHVAGTVGGSTYGVAKGTTLVPVRVLDCAGSGSTSGVIAGVDWVAGSSLRPAVANLSLGGGYYAPLNQAVAGAVGKGVSMVVAAGNSNANACNSSPASEPLAITVGATTSADARASYSNFGSCLDVFAPGSSITSAWYTSTTAINTISGTSMASPHVAGIAALALAANPGATPAQVSDFITTNATQGVVTSAGTGSPNRLVYSLASNTPAVQRTAAVTAITGKGTKAGSNWKASATVTVKEFDGTNFGNGIFGATVTGSFAPGGSASCVTGSTGSCTLSSASINRAFTSSTFTLGTVSGAGLVFDANSSVIKTVTVSRP